LPDDDAPSPCPIELTCRPAAHAWPELVRTFTARVDPDQRADQQTLRAELGLATDRPVVLSGHQPGLWHMGILAKRFALEACAARAESAPAWVIVDHDADDAGALRVPTPSPDAPGGIEARTLRLASADASRPLGLRPPTADLSSIREAVARGLDAWIPARLNAIADAVERHADADSLAAQLHGAAESLLRDALGDTRVSPAMPIFGSLSIARSALFQHVLERMRDDPERCRSSYNSAVDRVGTGAGVRALAPGELPIWALRNGRRFAASDASLRDEDAFAPRGLMMTGLLRRAACDLFIHGTGGGGTHDQAGYDAVTDLWLAEWLGWRTPAPSVVATATARLPFPGEAVPPTARELAALRWRAHHAAHAPAMLGDRVRESEKRAILEKLHASTDRAERAALFHELHALLSGVRGAHAERLRSLHAQADAAAARIRASGLRADRTWSFALHPPERVRALRDAVFAAFDHATPVPKGARDA